MLIRLIPRVCDEAGVTDPEKCKVLLDYCDGNDSQEACATKMIGHAIVNPANFTDAFGAAHGAFHHGAHAIDVLNHDALLYWQDVQDSTTDWYNNVHGEPTAAIVDTVRFTLAAGGLVLHMLGQGLFEPGS